MIGSAFALALSLAGLSPPTEITTPEVTTPAGQAGPAPRVAQGPGEKGTTETGADNRSSLPHRDCDDTIIPTLELTGAAAHRARLRLHVFVDPLAEELISTWVHARRLAVSSEGEVDVEIHIVRRELASTALERDVELFAALALMGRVAGATSAPNSRASPGSGLEPIAHFIQRNGVRGVAAVMRRAELRELAELELGLPRGALAPAEDVRRCVQLRLDHDTQWLLERERERGAGLRTQPPWLALEQDGQLVDGWADDRALGATPMVVDAWRRRLRAAQPATTSDDRARAHVRRWPQPRSGQRELPVPPSIGARLGGPGLAHEVVIVLAGEYDPALQWALPKLLALREQHLGRLAITIVTRATPEAAPLAVQLCAARRLDLVQPFVQALLARVQRRSSADWERVHALVDAEIEAVRAVAATQPPVSTTPDPLACAVLGTDPRSTRGLVFDGVLVGFEELERVEAALRAPDPDASPLWVMPGLAPDLATMQ